MTLFRLPAIHATRGAALPLAFWMSTPEGTPSDEPDDDLDDVLDETGAVTNRSNGKTGTDTEAEPDPKS
ncbi:conserved hypothetical protein [Burkholderia sp. 8Y]|uniref:hypothetical protein n=1 Tax=Burkholderia sp. 8Y TaxID=2653133 RepID=UPI0012F0B104|nr:hypothetical protein [Burkholderia sp. 8Y]VXC94265.1 conserved hypothetical protein [Burkholderia sp. 8Y]